MTDRGAPRTPKRLFGVWGAALALFVITGCNPVPLDDGSADLAPAFPGGPPVGGPACADGVRGAGETDIDCGGPACVRCADGRSCLADADCAHARCAAGTCISCEDGRADGDESDVDCGGSVCARRCPLGYHCRRDADCATGLCRGGLCTQPATLFFQPPAYYTTGVGFAGLALADFDGDRLLDVAASDGAAGALIVLRGRGDGSFWPPLRVDLGPGARPGDLAAADLDGDGRADLAAAGGALVYVWRSDGGGGVVERLTWSRDAAAVALGDLDGDGAIDVAVGGAEAPAVGVFHGDGHGGFARLVDTALGPPGARRLAAADLDGDGCTDLVAQPDFGPTTVLLGALDGTLRAGGRYAFPLDDNGRPIGYAALGVGRFDGDALPDVVAAQVTGRTQLLLSDGAGGLVARHPSRAASRLPLSSASADFDGDGHTDVALGCEESSRIQVLLGDGDGGLLPGLELPFAPAMEGGSPTAVHLVRAGDLDGDGLPDLVAQAVYGDANAICVRINRTR